MNHFSLQSPITIAHNYWQAILKPDDLAIDATAGNGHDTLFLAQHCPVIAIDIQQQALDSTKALLKAHFNLHSVKLILGSHEEFPSEVEKNSVKLITYNLGYLPQGDKRITTCTETTLKSIQNALPLIKPGGLISIISYTGHPEGKKEESALLDFVQGLASSDWFCFQHRALNRKQAPCLTIIEKAKKTF